MRQRRDGHAIFVAVANGDDLHPDRAPDRPAGGDPAGGASMGGASMGGALIGGPAPGGSPGRAGGAPGSVVGFACGGRCRRARLADGEIEMLYVLDDYRDRGIGRRLLRAMSAHLAAVGCRSAALWVLRDNPARWFYTRLGGRLVAQEGLRYAGTVVDQVAVAWSPIESLLTATAPAREGS
nr:GNAT family N-acetyltransferase [Roseomonas acroporae]